MGPTYVDLHTHSTASDGTLTPTALMQAAAHAGLAGIALTDHDTGNGLKEAAAEAARLGLRFVPGIEISADYPAVPGACHILGHFIDPDAAGLKDMSRLLLEARNARNPRIIARLNELGCRVSMEQVEAIARRHVPDGKPLVIGRPHMAQALIDAGCVSSIKQAFDVYLGEGGSAYFPKERLTPRQSIECIHNAGGLATLAHPVQMKLDGPQTQTIVGFLRDAGLDGIEVWHADHGERERGFYRELARRYELVATGGSDFHGHNKADIALGRGKNNVRVPVEILDRLEARWRQIHHGGTETQRTP